MSEEVRAGDRHAPAEFYRGFAADYDATRFRRPYDRAVSERESRLVVDALGRAGSRVLEIGCGTGRITAALAPRVGGLVAVDVSPEMLELAARRVPPGSDVEYMLADVDDLAGRFFEGAFDAVVSLRVLPHLASRAHALEVISCLLRPGGECVVDTWNDRSFVGVARRWRGTRSRVETHFDRYGTSRDLLAAAGFDVLATMGWGYPRLGRFSLDRLGGRLAPSLAYATLFHAQKR